MAILETLQLYEQVPGLVSRRCPRTTLVQALDLVTLQALTRATHGKKAPIARKTRKSELFQMEAFQYTFRGCLTFFHSLVCWPFEGPKRRRKEKRRRGVHLVQRLLYTMHESNVLGAMLVVSSRERAKSSCFDLFVGGAARVPLLACVLVRPLP